MPCNQLCEFYLFSGGKTESKKRGATEVRAQSHLSLLPPTVTLASNGMFMSVFHWNASHSGKHTKYSLHNISEVIYLLFPVFLKLLYSEQVETDLCYHVSHAFTFHVRAWWKLKRLCVLVDLNFSSVLPFWGDFGQELFCKACHPLVISRTKCENWDGTDFKMGIGTRCSEYIKWSLHKVNGD